MLFCGPYSFSVFQPSRGKAKGGPYIAVHLRRKDFVLARGKEVPSLSMAAEQIQHLLRKQNLTSAFIATDAPHEGELLRLQGTQKISLIYEIYKQKVCFVLNCVTVIRQSHTPLNMLPDC